MAAAGVSNRYFSLQPNEDPQKMPLREKVIKIYESLLEGDDLPQEKINFWDEFFLLKANVVFLESTIDNYHESKLIQKKGIINFLFARCCDVLNGTSWIRMTNSLQTICALVRSIYRKKLSNFGFDIIDILIGFDESEVRMQNMLHSIQSILLGAFPVSLQNLSLKLLLILSTGRDNVSQNTMVEYLMLNNLFDCFMNILANPKLRRHLGYDTLLLLGILMNYRKYDTSNVYLLKLSALDDEVALRGMGAILYNMLSNRCSDFENSVVENSGGMLSQITGLIGSLFVSEDSDIDYSLRTNEGLILALYQVIHQNRNFMTVLCHSHDKSSNEEVPKYSTPLVVPQLGSLVTPSMSAVPESHIPANVLCSFLTSISIITRQFKDAHQRNIAKLCFITLNCLVEDQYANAYFHDTNIQFAVNIYKAPMRHRKEVVNKIATPNSLACAILDLMTEFIASHLVKKLPTDLYGFAVGIIRRLISYQKKHRIRLNYDWQPLWTALIYLIKFLLSNEATLIAKADIFATILEALTIFNLFITYGDTFLPNPKEYDELYYEIIRMHQVFDNVHSMSLRHTNENGIWKESSTKVTRALVNIRSIISHFTLKIDYFSASHDGQSLTSEQVLSVVRNNYDSLTLKLQDSLDQFERYAEKPKHTSFFTQLVRSITSAVRRTIPLANLDYQLLLEEYSSLETDR
ncbi:UPF0668 protein C10orf76-like protein [Trichoplax sp. H2]|nr:UPF0668 protein C10orf76-like protein [Trichoplax sp. H2]|eukprot:RDD43523.1 UPF0668 protein C10orf76-like protein [Trichoplax sp. H2]